jgi:MOSC domain-containing protein YiiM
MNEPQMAALLVSHGRPGFYFRVIEEGEVEAVDEIVQVTAGPERVTVAEAQDCPISVISRRQPEGLAR